MARGAGGGAGGGGAASRRHDEGQGVTLKTTLLVLSCVYGRQRHLRAYMYKHIYCTA